MKTSATASCGLLAVFLSTHFLSAQALAEEPAPSASPSDSGGEDAGSAETERPKMHLSVAEPGEPAVRSAYVHNGFYLRTSVGGGLLTTNLRAGSGGSVDKGAGFALGADLMVGGSPSPGMALGLGALGNIGFSSGLDSNLALSQVLVGPFLDAFPNDRDGWHLGILAGVSPVFFDSDVYFGGGAGAMAGYDLWVAPEWSAGFNLRLTGTHSVLDGNGITNFSTVLLISILNH